MNRLILGDCLEKMLLLEPESVDLVVTSPPYDNLRTYSGNNWKLSDTPLRIWNSLKTGGVVVWIVADACVNGSETGTSFRHALSFMSQGFRLHDTMIYAKNNVVPLTHSRYEQGFEYMFVFSKGKPKTFNPIHDKPNKRAGSKFHGTWRAKDGKTVRASGHNKKIISDYGRRTNLWFYNNNGKRGTRHPATFPKELARDHILSWSSPGDTVMDPFMGSGTTGLVASGLGRHFVGIEISQDYFEIVRERFDKEGIHYDSE